MPTRNLDEWLAWQEQLHPESIELGLQRVSGVAQKLGSYSRFSNIPTITVAGTNGKGSCVTALQAILCELGLKVGAYTSPHLLRYNERVRINGAMVEDDALCASFTRIDKARGKTSLTYFEFGTLAALDIFAQEQVDIQLLEVGLGGRLDAVNIIDPTIAIVTNIALDHQSWLGSDRETIGKEKAGIFRADIPLIVGEAMPPASVVEAALALSPAQYYCLGHDFGWRVDMSGEMVDTWFGQTQDRQTEDFTQLPRTNLPAASVACAIQALQLLDYGLTAAHVNRALQELELAGRFQQIEHNGVIVICDVAHNPAAATQLSESLQERGIQGVSCVFSSLQDKDYCEVMHVLDSCVDHWYLAPLPVPRALTAKKLAQAAQDVRVEAQVFDTIGAALEAALHRVDRGGCLLVCGSFFTVAEALLALGKTVD